MRFCRLIFALLLVLAVGRPALCASDSADAPHLHVQLMTAANGITAPGQLPAGLYFKLENGWHVYWLNPGDAGQPPKINWTLPSGITAGPMQFPAPKRLPLGPLMDFGYEDEVLFPLMLKADSSVGQGSIAHVAARVNWLVCRETCIPGKANLSLDLPVTSAAPPNAANAALISKFTSLLPKPMPPGSKLGYAATADGFRLTAITGQRETKAEFFPADPDVIANAAPQSVHATANGLTLDLKKDPNASAKPAHLLGLLELSGGRAYEIIAMPGAPATPQAPALQTFSTSAPASSQPAGAATGARIAISSSEAATSGPGLFRIVGLAFLGGIILNLMPCVFPVLFLKGLALVNSGNEERHKLRAHGLVYTAGIVLSFWALVGVLLALRAAGSRLGWGFQFQSPIFLSLMAGLLFFLGLSLAGQFEIGLSLTSAGGSLAAKQGYTGSFFTGVLAVIVATPCTAPFMGAAIGYALAAPAIVTFAVFTALALGLAAPYLALTLQPAWTRILPRPGAWMEVLRQAISVPIFGTVIWLAWVVASAYGATMLAALLASFLLLAIAGWFLGRWPAKGWSAAMAVLIILCVVALSVASKIEEDRVHPRFDSSKVLTIHLPPFDPDKQTSWGDWSPWSNHKVATYLANGRPVFVDFTAKWCLSCQVNERVALTQSDVMTAFARANVGLLKADWTQHDDAISQELEKLGRSGVPVYALYAPGQASPQLLPEALTPGIVLDALGKLPPAAATQGGVAAANPQ